MNAKIVTINCRDNYPNTNRRTPFEVVEYHFCYKSSASDKEFIDDAFRQGDELARSVNPHAANNSTQARALERIKINCVAGIIAERLWKSFLNHNKKIVEGTPYTSASAQIDLIINKNKKKIEVRSSFPRRDIEFVICHERFQFDVIGPYANEYKASEPQKDYYVRTLFHVPSPFAFFDEIKKENFVAHLTGGATWAMMIDDRVAINKNFIPEDEINVSRIASATQYRVVPFSRALNTIEIQELIVNE